MARPSLNSLRISDIYTNLYPWRSVDEFYQCIKSTIVYKSEDNSLLAFSKPFGVGTFTPNDNNMSKQNQDRALSRIPGRARYCIADILEPLANEYNSPEPYKVIKGINRYCSGLTIVSNKYDQHRKQYLKAVTDSRSANCPPFGFRAITCGYPLLKSNRISEKVGLELIEVDELGDFKEPIIVHNITRQHKTRHIKDKSTFQTELEVKKINRELSTALVELHISKLSDDFARCYISSKTAFVMGDSRYSKRIRQVLDKKIQVSAFKSSGRYEDGYEPLDKSLRKILQIRGNSWLPIMLDMHRFRLKNFHPKNKAASRDLVIESTQMPLHFAATAEALSLLD